MLVFYTIWNDPSNGGRSTTPGPNAEESDTTGFILIWLIRQALLSIILALSFAEMKTSGSSIHELSMHFCGCRTQTACLTYPLRLACFFIPAIPFLCLAMAPFFLFRMLRRCCCRCLRPCRWLRVGTWLASERDFIFTFVVLEMVDFLWQLVFTPDVDKKYGRGVTLLWWFASLQTVLFVRVLWARFQVTQPLAHAVSPQLEFLQGNHV